MAFRLDRKLLKPNFDGYKYDSKFLCAERKKLPFFPKEKMIDDSYYDFTHLKLLSLTNGLFVNEFNDDNDAAYCISQEGYIFRIKMGKNGNSMSVNQMSDMKLVEVNSLEYPPAILFPQKDICLIIYEPEELWEFCDVKDFFDIIGRFYCYTASVFQKEHFFRLAICCAHGNINKKKNNLIKIVDIYFQSYNSKLKLTKVEQHVEFKCEAVPSWARFVSCDNSSCCFISEGKIYSYALEEGDSNDENAHSKPKNFTWVQTLDMITIQPSIFLRDNAKDTIDCCFKSQSLHFKWFDENGTPKINLQIKFFNPIVDDSCRWTITDDNKLEIHIIKEKPMIWPQLFLDSSTENSVLSTIEHIISDEEKHFLSESLSSLDTFTTSNCSEDFGEEFRNDDDCCCSKELYFADLKTFSVKKVETNATQVLFTLYNAKTNNLKICTDNLEDGIVWNIQIKNQDLSVVHEATFHALAYIVATKRDTLFQFVERTSQSYLVILDCSGHVLIYENPNFASPNQSKARQSSINIHERPIGAVTLLSKTIILTSTSLYVLNVNI